jgi:hypothetical protein
MPATNDQCVIPGQYISDCSCASEALMGVGMRFPNCFTCHKPVMWRPLKSGSITAAALQEDVVELTDDERVVLAMFCMHGTPLDSVKIADARVRKKAPGLAVICSRLIEKGYLIQFPGRKYVYHLTERGTQYCIEFNAINRRSN